MTFRALCRLPPGRDAGGRSGTETESRDLGKLTAAPSWWGESTASLEGHREVLPAASPCEGGAWARPAPGLELGLGLGLAQAVLSQLAPALGIPQLPPRSLWLSVSANFHIRTVDAVVSWAPFSMQVHTNVMKSNLCSVLPFLSISPWPQLMSLLNK